MRRIVLFIEAYILWVLLAWPFAKGEIEWQSIGVGGLISIIAALIFGEIFKETLPFKISRFFWVLVYIPVFFYYMFIANIDVLYRVLHPKMPINPGIVKVKTDLKTDAAITALCNSITLTPGTLTVDLTEDGYLYVHWINVKSEETEEATRRIVKRFEGLLRRIFE